MAAEEEGEEFHAEGEFDDERSPERNRVLYKMIGMEDDPIEDIYGVMAAYFGMVRFMDDGLGQILDALENTGLRENTIVVFCSDHGDFMGEHRMQCKGGVFYDSLTRVPLIVSWPGQVEAGIRDGSMANLIDVVPTLLQLQGMETPWSMHGEPLPMVTDALPSAGQLGLPPLQLRPAASEAATATASLPSMLKVLEAPVAMAEAARFVPATLTAVKSKPVAF